MRMATAAVLSIAALIALGAYSARAQDAGDTAIGIDADPQGNTATALGIIDECVEVASGDTFEVDVFVRDVTDLLAWSADLRTDPEIIQVVDRDVELFQAANEGSNVNDGSQQTPDSDGRYSLAGFDTADPASPDSGSGVLARVTLEALAPGVSPLELASDDIDGDGVTDRGPFLNSVEAEPIGDEDGDTFFDGDVADARVAVDMPCPADDDDGGGLDTWLIVVLALAGAAVVAAVIIGGLVLRGRGASAP